MLQYCLLYATLLSIVLMNRVMSTLITSNAAKKILLGSGSSTRKAIVNEMGFEFEVVKADIDERAIGDRSSDIGVEDLVLLLANAKADAILERLSDEQKTKVLLTADQVVTYRGKVLEKPLNENEAREFIVGYGTAPCRTVGSCVLTDPKTGIRVMGVDVATIHFDPIPEDSITKLIEEGEVYYCAGGLMVEHKLVRPHITKMEGTEESVMGLSPDLLAKLWDELQSKLSSI
jgi:septum formation protein